MPQAQELISQIYIKVNGKNVSEEIMDNLINIEVDDSILLPDMFSIHLRDSDFELMDGATFDLGKTVDISAKARGESSTTEILSGEIIAVEPEFIKDIGATVLITGYSKSHRLHRGTKTRTFLNKKDSDIVQQIARECGLTANVDSTSQVHEHIYQDNQTDMEFIMDIARRVGYYVYFEGGKFNFRKEPRASGRKPVLEWGDNLLEFQARLTTAEQVNTVEAHGWDIKTKKAIIGKSTSPKGTPKVGGESHGGALAKKSLHVTSEEVVNHSPLRTQKEADERAQAALNELGSTFFQAEGTCTGNPAVHAGVEVEIKEIGKRFSGNYRVSRAVHRYDDSGYTTRFEITGYRANTLGQLLSSSNNSNNGGRGYGVIVGQVTNIKDPDGLARVKVKFPSISDKEESTWARLVSPMAGAGRGIEFIPEVNDEVLVAFEYNDINHPYILGSLWNGKDKPPQPNGQAVDDSGKVVKRVIQSRAGHKIILDDTDGEEKISIIDKTTKNLVEIDSKTNLVTVKTEKNSIEIGTDKNTLTIKTDGAISMETKDDVTIKGKNITMEATANAKMKASSNLDLEANSKAVVKGNAGVDVQASGQVTVKGATINLN